MLIGCKTEEDPSSVTYPPSPWHVDNVEHSMLNASSPATAQIWMQNLAHVRPTEDLSLAPTTSSYNTTEQLSVGFPPLVNHILSFAYGVVIPTTWPNEFGKAKWTYEISRTWEDLAAINQDSCYASALLCFYATLMAAATNNKDTASQACFFQVQAMTELRRKLSAVGRGSDLLTLKSILKLFSAETAFDNTAAARVHLKMLRTFVGAGGGIMTMDSWLRENVLSADCYFALRCETRPLFPASEWTPGPLSHLWRTQLLRARIRDDHSSSVHLSVEHINLRHIITDLRELFRVERYINEHDVASEDSLLRWRLLRRYECINRLADHQLSVKIYPHLYVRPKLQLAACTAIALMAAMVLGCPEPVRSGLKLLKELRGKIMEARAEHEDRLESDAGGKLEDIDRFMFWILNVGKVTEQVHPIDSNSIWFLHEFENAALELELSEEESQKDLFKTFLFSSSLQEEIQNARPRRVSESRKGVYEACGMSWRVPLDSLHQGQSGAEDVGPERKGKERAW